MVSLLFLPPAHWFRQPCKQLGWSNDGRLESDVIFECVSLLLYPKDAINSLLASIKTSTQDHKAWKTNMVHKKLKNSQLKKSDFSH